jgi:Tfp pilus assembly protein PilX
MPRHRQQDGWAVVTVIMIVALMIAFGLATLAFVDTQSKVSGNEPVREASFNLGETALDQEMYVLAHPWPTDASKAVPATCSDTSSGTGCPSPTSVAQAVSGTFAAGSSWTVTVRDNLGAAASTYSRTVLDSIPCQGTATVPCTWDSNGDGLMWVRAQGTAHGHTRTVVALVQARLTPLTFPNFAIVAGKFSTSNNGNKVIADLGSSGLAVRCTSSGPSKGDPCLNYLPVQVPGANAPQTNYTDPLLSSDALQQLRTRAILDKTYYSSGCPPTLTGAVVFIENGNCSYSSGANSAGNPGVVVMNQGTLDLNTGVDFYGLVYHANGNPSPPAIPNNESTLVTIHGNASFHGAIMVDGAGGVDIGSSGGNTNPNFVFDDSVLQLVKGYGDAGISSGGFRELVPGQ